MNTVSAYFHADWQNHTVQIFFPFFLVPLMACSGAFQLDHFSESPIAASDPTPPAAASDPTPPAAASDPTPPAAASDPGSKPIKAYISADRSLVPPTGQRVTVTWSSENATVCHQSHGLGANTTDFGWLDAGETVSGSYVTAPFYLESEPPRFYMITCSNGYEEDSAVVVIYSGYFAQIWADVTEVKKGVSVTIFWRCTSTVDCFISSATDAALKDPNFYWYGSRTDYEKVFGWVADVSCDGSWKVKIQEGTNCSAEIADRCMYSKGTWSWYRCKFTGTKPIQVPLCQERYGVPTKCTTNSLGMIDVVKSYYRIGCSPENQYLCDSPHDYWGNGPGYYRASNSDGTIQSYSTPPLTQDTTYEISGRDYVPLGSNDKAMRNSITIRVSE